MKKIVLNLLFSVGLASFAYAIPTDSLRVEVAKDGKKAWIIHKVEPKETIYGIAKRYKTTSEDIAAENPEMKELKIDQVLRVPYKDFDKMSVYTASQNTNTNLDDPKKHTVATGEGLYGIAKKYGVTMKEIRKWNNLADDDVLRVGQVLIVSSGKNSTAKKVEKTAENNTLMSSKKIIHEVKEDEYPYGIAKKYNVKLTEFQEWNNLTKDSKLVIGQKLEIYPTGYKKSAENVEKVEKVVGKVEVPVEKKNPLATSDYKPVVEQGIAELISDDNTASYCGLHKDVAVGTIVSVKNQMNGETVFVRIIGKLPASAATEKTIIKLSKNAYEALGGRDTRFRVEVSYIP